MQNIKQDSKGFRDSLSIQLDIKDGELVVMETRSRAPVVDCLELESLINDYNRKKDNDIRQYLSIFLLNVCNPARNCPSLISFELN